MKNSMSDSVAPASATSQARHPGARRVPLPQEALAAIVDRMAMGPRLDTLCQTGAAPLGHEIRTRVRGRGQAVYRSSQRGAEPAADDGEVGPPFDFDDRLPAEDLDGRVEALQGANRHQPPPGQRVAMAHVLEFVGDGRAAVPRR